MNYNNFTHRPSLTSSHSTNSTSTRHRLEDAQPSELVNTNTRPKQPPPVIKAHQPPTIHSMHGLPTGPRNTYSRQNDSRGSLPNRPRPQTTAGGWSTSTANSTAIGGARAAASSTAGGTGAANKGKERSWGNQTMGGGGGGGGGPSSMNSYSSTPVAIPINPRPKIYVSQLPPSVTEDELRTVFSPYGQIVEISINSQLTHSYAHITFATSTSASNAISTLRDQPFPSINGIGSSRPLKIEYASQGPRVSNGNHGVVTTEPPTDARLFNRATETPDLGQNQSGVIKGENESPVKRSNAVDGGERERERSNSSNYTTASSNDHRPHSPPPAPLPFSHQSNPPFPPFLNPPSLSYLDVSFPPLSIGTYHPSQNPSPSQNPRTYLLTYAFSSQWLESGDKERWQNLKPWLNGMFRNRMEVLSDTVRVEQTQEGERLGFVVSVTKKTLSELGRGEEWSREERDEYWIKREEMKREVKRRLRQNGARGDQGTRSTYPFINPPILSFDQIPLLPLQLGTFKRSTTKTFILRYLYPPSLLPAIEKRITDRFKSSGIKIVGFEENAKSSEKDLVSVGEGEAVIQVEVEFLLGNAIETYGRSTEWDEKERREVLLRLEGMRKIVREKNGRGREKQPDGTYIERLPLPVELRGGGMEQVRGQTLLRVEEVKKRSLEGKVVLGSSIDGDFISINYFVDETVAPIPPSSSSAPPPLRPITTTADTRMIDDSDDIKPSIVQPVRDEDGEADMEIDQLDSATPEPLAPTVKFPLQRLENSRADSIETYQAVTSFVNEYFRRFDSSRSTLEGFYTNNALFTLKIDTIAPKRATTPITLFSRHWIQAAHKAASTPIAITNAIRKIPAGSHNLDKLVFNARAIPEFHLKKRDKPPILLHLVGEFEEFPEKITRRFERTLVLVPRSVTMDQREGPGDFIIHSDQLSIGHKAVGEPRELIVSDVPFPPASSNPTTKSTSNPPQVTSSIASAPPVGAAPQPRPQSNIPAFSPPPPHTINHPTRPQPTTATSTPNLTARAPVKRPRASSVASNASTPPTESTSTSPRPAAAPVPLNPARRRLSEGEVLVLSDTESVASRQGLLEPRRVEGEDSNTSLSPEVARPAKRPNISNNGSKRNSEISRRRDSSETSSGSASSTNNNAPPRPLASASTSQPRPPPPPSRPSTSDAPPPRKQKKVQAVEVASNSSGLNQDLAPEIQRLIAEQVEREVKKRLGEGMNGGNHDSESARKKMKGKEKEVEKVKEKKKKSEKVATGLGTGLSSGDSRIVIAGLGHSILHGFDGRSNKLRGMVKTADASSFLSVSLVGDICEYSMQPLNSMTSSSITKLYTSTQDKYRVDDFSYNSAKDTLLVGYLGRKEGKEMESPPNQVVLYKREVNNGATKLIETKLPDAPHINGGVTAIMALPCKASTGRLRFVTGGEDKKVYLWTRQRSTQSVKIEKFRTEHTSMITSLAYLESRDELISGGKDRRVVVYDVETKKSNWQATLSTAVMSVSSVMSDPNLILSRLATPSSQFLLHDCRIPATSAPILNFGYDLPPHRSSNGTLVPTNMGRYPRGDQMDTVIAFPDHAEGVKLWDLRQLKSEIVKKQDLGGLGRSKVVQCSFRGREELCLMELGHFTRLSLKG